VAELIIERNFPVVTPNKPQKNLMNRPRRLSFNRRKPNSRWRLCSGHLGWAPELSFATSRPNFESWISELNLRRFKLKMRQNALIASRWFPGQENHSCDISTQKTHECRFLII
jgi:hypothetical protein